MSRSLARSRTTTTTRRRIEVWKLCARTYCKARKAVVSRAQAEKIGRVSALPGINLSGVVAGSAGRTEGRFVRPPLSGILSNQTTSAAIDLFSQRPRKIPITLVAESRPCARIEIESANDALRRVATNDARLSRRVCRSFFTSARLSGSPRLCWDPLVVGPSATEGSRVIGSSSSSSLRRPRHGYSRNARFRPSRGKR